ncbi:putative transcriptional regulator [Thiovulum sp. ES]|nr:putative transcriptional regulator [Thiovulum sp. ES]
MENKEENLVKKTCRELGITQKELAEKIGVNPKTISNWQTKKMEKYAEVLLSALINEDKYFKAMELFTLKT